jgi:recombination protein RecT
MTQALRVAVTGNAPAKKSAQANTIAGLLSDPKIKQQMALALPKHMNPDRLARIALTEVRKVPALGKCDQASFLGAIMQCAQLGLEPGGALGHAYLLPFENRKKGITEVQFIVGYRGMLDLARRSGQIQSIEARAVYSGDQFHVSLGLNPDLQHVPDWESPDRGPAQLRFVYAVAKLKDGGTQFEVMSRADIERVRAQSKAGQSGPWVTHFEEMAKKTVIRRLFKYLPVSIELAQAVSLDEQAESGLQQDNPLTIDADTGEMTGGDPVQDDGAPALTYAEVADRLHQAATVDALAEAADLIGTVADETQRAELAALYRERSEKVGG